MPRFSELNPDTLTAEQKVVFDNITSGPRGGVRGPFQPMMLSPGVCDYVQGLGAYFRFDGVLPVKLRELAILTTARFWKAEYEWDSHVPFAEKEGLDPAIINAIAEGKTPDFKDKDEKIVHAFITELHHDHQVSDAAFNAVKETFGEEATLELTAVAGYYTLISMVLKTFQVEAPEGGIRFT